jgi:hypothetical protein
MLLLERAQTLDTPISPHRMQQRQRTRLPNRRLLPRRHHCRQKEYQNDGIEDRRKYEPAKVHDHDLLVPAVSSVEFLALECGAAGVGDYVVVWVAETVAAKSVYETSGGRECK